MSFREWLSCAAQEMSKSAFDLCLTLVSNIWGARNALLWNGKHTPPMELVIMTESWLQAYHHWHSPVRSNKNKPKQYGGSSRVRVGLNAILMELGTKDLKS